MGKRTRRQFIQRSMLGFGGYLAVTAAACKPGAPGAPAQAAPAPLPKSTPADLRTLTPGQHALLVAACERILPRDQDPGATDLGCARYIDRALEDPDTRALFGRALLGGITALDAQAQRRHQQPFALLLAGQQDALLSAWQTSRHSGERAFFEVLHALTLEGAFGDPSHGGNTDGRGFVLIGFRPPPPNPPLVPLQAK